MKEKRIKRNVSTKKKVKSKAAKTTKSSKKTKIELITIVDYTFLISLVLSVIFGMQTNGAFFIPFTITLIITIACMGIILVNSIYSKIKKKFKKK